MTTRGINVANQKLKMLDRATYILGALLSHIFVVVVLSRKLQKVDIKRHVINCNIDLRRLSKNDQLLGVLGLM